MNSVAIIEELSEDQMRLLGPLFASFSCRAGSIIFQQGTPAEFLYLIISGKVEVSFKPCDGNPSTVSHVEKGGLFGWSAVGGSKNYASSAVALEEVEARRIRGSELCKFCMEHPDAGKDILERLANGVSSRRKDARKSVKSFLMQSMQI